MSADPRDNGHSNVVFEEENTGEIGTSSFPANNTFISQQE